jgi:tetraacyldisaccharide 4'-kinase
MRTPDFWAREGVWPTLLAPASAAYAAATARRLRRPGFRAPVPVICCGGVTAGGAGKTPLALDFGARLQARGRKVAFLTRGYGGTVRGVLAVDPTRHDAALAGDEALLLAAVAETFVAADRAAGARAAVAAGAEVLVMDDGLQNPTLRRDFSFLVIDGGSGFGNGRVIPAGPLREPVAAAAARCRAAVLLGDDATGAASLLPPSLPLLRARLVVEPDPALAGARVLAFSGIAHPEKFFASVREAGAAPVACRGFADHHAFTAAELEWLHADAAAADAVLLTTAKDAVRLPAAVRPRVRVLRVRLAWDKPAAIEQLLDTLA